MYKHLFTDEAEFDQFTPSTLEIVERKLHVKLPDSYIHLMKLHNGGTLAYNTLVSGRVPDGEVEIDEIKGIDLEDGIIESAYLTEEWGLDPKLIIFAGDGNYWLAFDYRKHDANEPPIVYIEEDAENKPKQVAKTFELFLKKLEKPEEDDFEIEDDDDDEDNIIYTKEEFEKNVSKGKSFIDISNGFYQFAREECDMEWFVSLAIKAVTIKKIEDLAFSISEEVLFKMKQTPSEYWPIKLLEELSEELNHFKDGDSESDRLAVKYGKQIKRKIK